MFKHIRRRLVILNAVVFLLILVVLSGVLYFHMRYRLLHDVDEILQQARNRISVYHNISELLKEDHADPQQDERTTYLFWNEQHQLVGQSPKQSFPAEQTDSLRDIQAVDSVTTVRVQDRSYRYVQFPVHNRNAGSVAFIGVVRSLGDVEQTLRSLLRDILMGISAAVLICVGAGWLLANRALIPIQQAWEKQQRFVADASHELRTPTAVIQAQTELLFRHPSHTIEQESPSIGVILKESKRMSRLLDDLLTLARSDSNQLEIQPSVIALDTLMRELCERFRLLATTKQVEIAAQLQESISFWGDEARIRQLVIILLDNALKYTMSSGRIEVTVHSQANTVYLCVSDTGCGIAEEELPYIFDRFYRGDKVRSRAEGGVGLGLSIARWIVDVHGGDIRVTSKINAGTRVEVSLPNKPM